MARPGRKRKCKSVKKTGLLMYPTGGNKTRTYESTCLGLGLWVAGPGKREYQPPKGRENKRRGCPLVTEKPSTRCQRPECNRGGENRWNPPGGKEETSQYYRGP